MYQVNDEITMKKPHPCGNAVWTVVKTGADIKLRCKGCNKYVNLTRDEVKKRAKSIQKGAVNEGC